MKRRSIFCSIMVLMAGKLYAADVPTDVTLTPAETAIDVEWTGDDDADGYYVYWGTSSDDLDESETVDAPDTSYTIEDLDGETTYYIAVSSFEDSDESDQSSVKSTTTLAEGDAPSTPTDFSVTSLDDITQSSVVFDWDENEESDLDHYNIYFDTTADGYGHVVEADDTDYDGFRVSGLTSATRYYFAISAVDTSDNESDKSENVIVDLLPDSLAPFEPADIDGVLSDVDSISVTVTDANQQMADFAGTILYYGENAGDLDNSVDLGDGFTYTLEGLSTGTTWFFAASSYDYTGNESSKTPEVGVTVEETVSFLTQADGFEGGCFITNSKSRADIPLLSLFLMAGALWVIAMERKGRTFLTVLIVIVMLGIVITQDAHAESPERPGNNIVGITAGYFRSNQSEFKEFYSGNTYPVFGFYDRFLSRSFSVGVESGFLQKSGHLMTVSGAKTDIESTLTIIPVSGTLKFNMRILPYIVGYMGAGPDYWYCKEETDDKTGHPEISEWVGGYHGTLGVRLCNTDENYSGIGALFESSYSRVDRFGKNETDIGGWVHKFGIFYHF